MATILADYLARQDELRCKGIDGSMSMEEVVGYQEINYRVNVLETCKALTISAPVTTDAKKMGFHYQLTEAVLGAALTDHKVGPKTDDEGEKKRETAYKAVERVFQDGKRRFRSFKATTKEQYKDTVSNFINTVIQVWIQYRNTFIKI